MLMIIIIIIMKAIIAVNMTTVVKKEHFRVYPRNGVRFSSGDTYLFRFSYLFKFFLSSVPREVTRQAHYRNFILTWTGKNEKEALEKKTRFI